MEKEQNNGWHKYECAECDFTCDWGFQMVQHRNNTGHKNCKPYQITAKWEDEMTEQPSNKYDNGKPRLDLVPPGIIEAVGVVRTYGVSKYGDSESWKTVEPSRYRAAMMRHLCAYLRDPQSKDEESGISHLWHCATNIAFLIELEKGEKK